MRFLEFYNLDENYIPELYEINLNCNHDIGCDCDEEFLTEVNKNVFIVKTDSGRKLRSKDIKVRTTKVTDVNGTNLDRLMYSLKSKNSTEGKPQKGFIDYDPADEAQVYNLYCTCLDYKFRMFWPLQRVGLADYDIPKPFDKFDSPPTHDQTEPKLASNKQLRICKHLYHIMTNYLDDSEIEVKPLELKKPEKEVTKKEPEEIEKDTLDKQELKHKQKQDREELLNKQKQALEIKKQKDLEKKQAFKKNLGKKDQEIKNKVDDQIEEPSDEEDDEEDKDKKEKEK